MNFNKILKPLFGDNTSRDMKLIQPLVEKVKQAYPDIAKLSNDELRAKSKEIRDYVQGAAKPYQEKIAELKAKIEETPIDEREPIFNEIDKQDKEMLDALENALNEVMPVAFSIVKDTARRFSENEETLHCLISKSCVIVLLAQMSQKDTLHMVIQKSVYELP